jgi:hypothetical protein
MLKLAVFIKGYVSQKAGDYFPIQVLVTVFKIGYVSWNTQVRLDLVQ